MLGLVVLCVLVMVAVNLALAAVVVGLRWRNERTARRWHRWEERWQPPILDLLAGDATPECLHEEVTASEAKGLVDICARFARRLTGHDRRLVCEVARPFLLQLRPKLASRRAAERARAVQTLGELGFADHAEHIVGALDDASPLVAMLTARTIARHGETEHVEAVVGRLDRFELWSPALLAAMLAAVGPQIAAGLRARLAEATGPLPTLVVSARALALLRDVPAADIAADGLHRDAHPELLAAQLRLIQALGRASHIGPVRAMATHPEPTVRAHAMAALGRIGAHGDRVLLRRGIDDESPWVAVHAAHALRQLDGVDELEALAASEHPRALVAAEALTSGVS
ncbi:MAG: HEAT repeat domain-containing protein [Thermoleophilia bacterium]|nr:HEAT repeat domain-containing protein [Thermoleophilia bacterium]